MALFHCKGVEGKRGTQLRKLSWSLGLCLALIGMSIPTPAQSAKVGREFYEDTQFGFRFKYPHEWGIIPVPTDELDYTVAKFDGPDLRTKTISGSNRLLAPADLIILRMQELTEEDLARGQFKASQLGPSGRLDVAHVVPYFFGVGGAFDPAKPEVDKKKKISGVQARQRIWRTPISSIEYSIEVWDFPLEEEDICFVFNVPTEHERKWINVFDKSARTFERIERIELAQLEEGGTYSDVIAYHEGLVARSPGWRVVPTPSKQFLIKTSSDNDKFIDEVIDRLELSRALFEKDFPPATPITDVSVVRVCSSPEDFQSYTGTGPGTAGVFIPNTIELVLYDNVEVDRNSTYAVMTHEAFHQYCHFLFQQSEAHRWFDEGHGDYYGGVKFTHNRAKVTPTMPGGLNRLSVIKTMMREDTWIPIADHLYTNHRQWQNQGPSNVSYGNVTNYAQSWSVIYFLREGTAGNVTRKIFRKEYADIIPNYSKTLFEGFQAAYKELREEREAAAKADGRKISAEELEINRFDLDSSRKQKIWDDAMEASWGQVDMEQFQEDWIVFVKKHL